MGISYTAHGLPKPNASELISSGWDAISDLADAVEAAALADSGWIAPALAGTWAAAGAPYPAIGYRLFRGIVYLRGRLLGPNAGTAFTLPAGYRPAATRTFPVAAAAVATFDVSAAGVVSISVGGGGGYFALDSIRFVAEQ